MNEAMWHRVCVVGLGAHARTKIIPAIAANGQQLAGVVTTRQNEATGESQVFTDLASAVSTLPEDTVFLLASPPIAHFEQARTVLAAGRDIVVEKPAFVTTREADHMVEMAERTGRVLVDAFMHRHTGLYLRFLDNWVKLRDQVASIDISFLIPGVPGSTFRQDDSVGCSLLFDVGCYAVSLLSDLGLPLDALHLTSIEGDSPSEEKYRLVAEMGSTNVVARVGIAPEYSNAVTLRLADGRSLEFRPFFYGRAGQKIIETHALGTSQSEYIHDGDAFEAMLAVSRKLWATHQAERLQKMVEVTGCLERLGESLAVWRRARRVAGEA